MCPNESVVHDLLGIGAVVQATEHDIENSALVTLHDFAECVIIARFELAHELRIHRRLGARRLTLLAMLAINGAHARQGL